MEKPQQLSPTTLAFVGDGVFSLLVREKLCQFDRPSGELHSRSVKLVNATAQAKAFKVIEPMLSETETSVFKRGRNAHTNTTPKNSTKESIATIRQYGGGLTKQTMMDTGCFQHFQQFMECF